MTLNNNSKIFISALFAFLLILSGSLVYAFTGYPVASDYAVNATNNTNSTIQNNTSNNTSNNTTSSTSQSIPTKTQKEIDEAQHNAIPPKDINTDENTNSSG